MNAQNFRKRLWLSNYPVHSLVRSIDVFICRHPSWVCKVISATDKPLEAWTVWALQLMLYTSSCLTLSPLLQCKVTALSEDYFSWSIQSKMQNLKAKNFLAAFDLKLKTLRHWKSWSSLNSLTCQVPKAHYTSHLFSYCFKDDRGK